MAIGATKEGDLLWQPSQRDVEHAVVTQYSRWLSDTKGLVFPDYNALWRWSVTELEAFWSSMWEFFDVQSAQPYQRVLSERRMPGAKWFEGAEVNYAQQVFRDRPARQPALLFRSELCGLTAVSWGELERRVAAVAASLRGLGVRRGDRVVACVPNIPEATVAFLATISVGAIWSCCPPDFGTRSIVDRFQQIEPKLLFTVDGYRYSGKDFSRRDEVAQIRDALPTLEHTVLIPYLDPAAGAGVVPGAHDWRSLLETRAPLAIDPVPFDHPLWVVYSSGTTGLPKPLVHSHGGVLLELQKCAGIHLDVHPGDRLFWFSTTGWIMWNLVQGSLLRGATALLFDGNPLYPDLLTLFRFAEETQATLFGTSAPFITTCMQAGLEPSRHADLSHVRTVGSTGSPLSPDGFRWVYDAIRNDVWLTSISGGTDIASAFLGGVPTLPVHAGELQCRCLGVKAEAFDEAGNSVVDEVGELVVTEPMPSMPLYLWNDRDGSRYHESYFEMYPGKWRHGDWVRITSRGSGVILGRSDSTLKRMGVRMGSSDFYNAVETMPEISESLIVGFETPAGQYRMPLFVVPAPGVTFDDALKEAIKAKIRVGLSPRHLPDEIYAIEQVPRTLNGKKLEVPVKKILMGWPLDKAANLDSMANPAAMNYFVDLARQLAAGTETRRKG